MARIRTALTAVALAVVGVACNAILGNDVHELDPRFGSGGPVDASVDADGSPSSQVDGARQDVNQDRNGAQDANDAGQSDTVVIPGEAGPDVGAVDSAEPADADDAAEPCKSGTTECRDRSVYTCSRILGWVETLQCNNACVGGSCTGVCVPGTIGCNGNTPQTCDAMGQWQSGAACAFLCNQGQCGGSCTPNTVQTCGNAATCNAGAIQRCDPGGTWGDCTPTPSTCLPAPANWQPVALTQSTTCPDGFGARQSYYTSATATAFTCSCNCGGTTQSCSGTATLNQYGPDAGASCTGTPSTRTVPLSSACSVANFGSIFVGDAYTVSNVTFGAAPICTATPTPTAQPAPDTQTTGVCSPMLSCPSGACLSSAQGVNMCVAQTGTQMCPPGFPNRTLMSPTFDDTRTCGPCSCGSSLACALTGVVLNNDSSSCSTGHPYVMTASTMCDSNAIAPSTFPLNAVQTLFTSTGDGTCAQTSPSAASGGVSLHDASMLTVCCP